MTIGAVLLGRHRATRLTIAGLGLALAGTALVIGLPSGDPNPVGIALAVASAVWYSGYILVGEQLPSTVDPTVTAVYVCFGAACSFTVVGAAMGWLDFHDVDAGGWVALACMALFATAMAITGFFAGMARIGSAWASITSSWEPVVTVILGVIVLHEDLRWSTVVGGLAVVLGAIVLPLVGGRTQEQVPPAP